MNREKIELSDEKGFDMITKKEEGKMAIETNHCFNSYAFDALGCFRLRR